MKRHAIGKHPIRQRIQDLEIFGWWDSETKDYQDLVLRFLASLPGGEELEGLGIEPFPSVGWKEAEMLSEMLVAIEDSTDVEDVVHILLPELFEEEEEEEEREPATVEEVEDLLFKR